MAQATKRPAAKAGTKAAQAAKHQGRSEPERQSVGRRDVARVPAEVKKPRTGTQVAEYGSAANLPDFMRDDAGMGKENITRDDIETPRLKLIQGTSPELTVYNDLKPGHFFHTAAEHIFDDEEGFRAVLIYMDRQYILWRPLDDGGGILARAADGVHWSPSEGTFDVTLDKSQGGHKVSWSLAKTVAQSGLGNWGTMNPKDSKSPPAATLMYNFVLAFPDHPELMPAVFSFQRSSLKIGKRLNTKLKTVRTPLFGAVWRFSPVEDGEGSRSFFNLNVVGDGLVEDKAEYMHYKQLHEGFAQAGLQIKDLEGAQRDGDNDGAGDDGDGKY